MEEIQWTFWNTIIFLPLFLCIICWFIAVLMGFFGGVLGFMMVIYTYISTGSKNLVNCIINLSQNGSKNK